MSHLNGIRKWVCVLALLSSTAALAQVDTMKIVIDNQPIPGADIHSIMIMPTSGDIYITTKNKDYLVQKIQVSGVQILSFGLDSSEVLAGDQVTVSWETNNADTCEASGGVDGWAGFEISANSGNLTAGSTKITTSTVGGPFPFVLTCTGSDGTTVSESRGLTVNSATALIINNFEANPTQIGINEETMVSWDVSNMRSCTPSLGTAEWQSSNINSSSGSVPININAAGDYTFRLNCVGVDGDEDFALSSVTVAEPYSVCPTPKLTGSTISWQSLFGQVWPLPISSFKEVNLGISSYRAIEFKTTNLDDRGMLKTVANVNANGIRLGAISECPGDFDVSDACKKSFGSGGIVWNTGATTSDCPLKKDTTYYFNLTFTDGVSPDTSTCDSSNCITTVQTYNPE